MACNSNNPTVIQWLSGKSTQYDASDLPFMRKKNDIDGSSSFKYYNPNLDRYEVPKDIVTLPKDFVAVRQAREEAKLIRSASITEEEKKKKLPANLRLHQHFIHC